MRRNKGYSTIQINPTLRVRRLDAENVVIETGRMTDPTHRRSKSAAHETWDILGYYGSWPLAMASLVEKFEPENEDLKSLVSDFEAFKAEIRAATEASGLH